MRRGRDGVVDVFFVENRVRRRGKRVWCIGGILRSGRATADGDRERVRESVRMERIERPVGEGERFRRVLRRNETRGDCDGGFVEVCQRERG